MSYVRKSLSNNEHILHTGRFHWTYKSIALAGLFLIIPGLIMWLRVYTTEIVITNRRLIYKRGWISRQTEEIGLDRLEEVNLIQGVEGRILGYGTLVCKGTGASTIELPRMLGNPMRFRRELQNAQALAA